MKKQRKSLFLLCKEYVEDSFSYIKESSNYMYFAIVIFLLSAMAGFAFAGQLGVLDSVLRNILDKTSGLSGIQLILFIFVNNASVSFGGLFFGIILGIFPLINLISNGIVLGYVLARVYSVSGISEFWRILPRGIFELPAIFISLGLGIKIGTAIFSKSIMKELRYRIVNSVKVFLFVVLPLLIVAAVIEGLLITLFR